MSDCKTSNNDVFCEEDFNFEDEDTFSYADYKFEDWLSFILFWLLALTVFSQFTSRYVFSAPLGWTEEVARYQLVTLGFLGSCIGIRRNSHIFVSLFHRWFCEKISNTIFKIIACVNVIFIACLVFFCYQIIPLLHIHQMASLPLSISFLYGMVLGSLLIMLLRSYQYLVTYWQQSSTTSSTNI